MANVEFEMAGETFKKIMNAVSILVDEIRIRFTPDGMSIKAVDPSNVAMVHLEIPSSSFSEYEVQEESVVAIDLPNCYAKISKFLKYDMTVAFSDSHMEIHSSNTDFKLPLLDPSSLRREPKMPEMDFSGQIEIKSGQLKGAIAPAEAIGDFVRFIIPDTKSFVVEAESEDLGSMRQVISRDDLLGIRGKAESIYSLDYMANMMKGIGSPDFIAIYFSVEYPLKLVFPIVKGIGEYLLAPRIQSEY